MNKIAIPIENGLLSAHFGHCEAFAIVEVNDGKVLNTFKVTPPEHVPGLYPKWIAGMGVNDVIAAGMGHKAIALFNQHQINVYLGAPAKSPEAIADEFLHGELTLHANPCSHEGLHGCHG